jgi:hypothetical protein
MQTPPERRRQEDGIPTPAAFLQVALPSAARKVIVRAAKLAIQSPQK